MREQDNRQLAKVNQLLGSDLQMREQDNRQLAKVNQLLGRSCLLPWLAILVLNNFLLDKLDQGSMLRVSARSMGTLAYIHLFLQSLQKGEVLIGCVVR